MTADINHEEIKYERLEGHHSDQIHPSVNQLFTHQYSEASSVVSSHSGHHHDADSSPFAMLFIGMRLLAGASNYVLYRAFGTEEGALHWKQESQKEMTKFLEVLLPVSKFFFYTSFFYLAFNDTEDFNMSFGWRLTCSIPAFAEMEIAHQDTVHALAQISQHPASFAAGFILAAPYLFIAQNAFSSLTSSSLSWVLAGLTIPALSCQVSSHLLRVGNYRLPVDRRHAFFAFSMVMLMVNMLATLPEGYAAFTTTKNNNLPFSLSLAAACINFFRAGSVNQSQYMKAWHEVPTTREASQSMVQSGQQFWQAFMDLFKGSGKLEYANLFYWAKVVAPTVFALLHFVSDVISYKDIPQSVIKKLPMSGETAIATFLLFRAISTLISEGPYLLFSQDFKHPPHAHVEEEKHDDRLNQLLFTSPP